MEWILILVFTSGFYTLQFVDGGAWRTFAKDWWLVYAAAYVGAVLLHFVATTRDG